jgi:hypothetical protein
MTSNDRASASRTLHSASARDGKMTRADRSRPREANAHLSNRVTARDEV